MTRHYHKQQCALLLKFYKMLTLGLIFRFSYAASQISVHLLWASSDPCLPAWKESEGERHSVVSNSLRPQELRSSWILQARIPEWVAFPFSRESSQPRSPALQADSLSAEPQGKPKNTGVGSLSLLLRIFPTQELNQGLLRCRRILYQLSYEGSPEVSAILKEGLSIPTHCVPVTQESVSMPPEERSSCFQSAG